MYCSGKVSRAHVSAHGFPRSLGNNGRCGHLLSRKSMAPRRRACANKSLEIQNVMGGRQDKGKKLDPEKVQLKSTQRPLGEGSFGTCFEATLSLGGDVTKQVVLKRVKSNVNGAQKVQEMEHVLNVYVNRACKATSVAPFLGYLEVDEMNASGKLTPGLWLVWEYEGDKTLSYYLKRRDCIKQLMEDLELATEEEVVPTVMRQVFESLRDLHGAGLVHRDIKPANLVFSEKQKRFKIIDLGAAADLRTGTNYSPQETMLDPIYCAPEEYVLPTDGPDMVKQGAMAFVMSPIIWSQHRPECFDSYSAGVVLLQLSLPFLRSSSSIKNWKQTMIRLKHDIREWREKAKLSSRQTALLDANDGAGWSLLEALLQPRQIEGDGQGGVKFVDRTGKAPRLTPNEALKHPFILGKSIPTKSAEVSSLESNSSEKIQRKKKGFNWLKSRVFDLEARIAQQASEAETQTTIVKKLEKEVAKGKATELDLEIERSRLEAMRNTLQSSMTEMGSLFESAKGFFSGGSSVQNVQPLKEEKEEEIEEERQEVASMDKSGDVQFFANAASSAIYSGLKFTGRALIAVADLATSAEESLSEAQAKRDAIRKEKAIMQELLSRMDLTSESSWDDVKDNVLNILDDSILSESQMRRTFSMYVNGMAREERMRLKQAKLDFGTLLMDAKLQSSITYDAFTKDFGSDPRFSPLDNDTRILLFDAHMESIKKREATLSLARDVLDMKKEDGEPAQSDTETLERLRVEQERMKSEYEAMEKKLKKMEKLLKTTNLLGIDRDDESVTFKFNQNAIPTPTKNSQRRKKKA